jgi:hypothetical protein
MNYDYIADTWAILKIISEDHPDGVYKLLCTFRGGYLYGDEWRISSGVTDVEIETDHYIITNESGSIYKCFKGAECLSSLTLSIYEKFKKELKDDLEIVKIEEYLKDKK